MNQTRKGDLARFYQDEWFDGRNLIAWSFALFFAGAIFSGQFPTDETKPEWMDVIEAMLSIAVLVMYFLGFFRGVRAKGLPRAYYALSLLSLIGIAILVFTPSRRPIGTDEPQTRKDKANKPA